MLKKQSVVIGVIYLVSLSILLLIDVSSNAFAQEQDTVVLDSVYYAEIGNKRFDVFYSGDVAEIINATQWDEFNSLTIDINQKKKVYSKLIFQK